MANAKRESAIAFLALEVLSVFHQEIAIHHVLPMASAIPPRRNASVKWVSRGQIAVVKLTNARMVVMAEAYASTDNVCVAPDGMDTPVKGGIWNLGLQLHLHPTQHNREGAKKLARRRRKVNRRSLLLQVDQGVHKQLLQRPHRQSAWVRHVEKVALALDTANVTPPRESVTVIQVGMEFFVTFSTVKVGMAHWDQTASAMGSAIQEIANVPQVGVKIRMQKTRLPQMSARIRFVQWAVEIMVNA